MRLTPEQFEQLVAEAIDSLPAPIATRLDNVEVVVERWPSRRQLQQLNVPAGETLLGLYEGVPLTQRNTSYGLVLPDKITIFSGPIEQMCLTADDVRVQISHTIVHEFAHFFGISDEQLKHWGVY
jgi:predicted Zn-dependent protease with MMP-like domain